MAKFDKDEWERRMRHEMEDQISGEAAAAARAAQDDAQLRKELTEMFGGADYKDIVKAIGAAEGYSQSEIDAMQKAAKKAKRQLSSNNPREAEKIIMSNRGLREARKKSGKGCAVLALVLTSGGLAALAGLTYAASEIIRAVGF